jgi:hypothetical protein
VDLQVTTIDIDGSSLRQLRRTIGARDSVGGKKVDESRFQRRRVTSGCEINEGVKIGWVLLLLEELEHAQFTNNFDLMFQKKVPKKQKKFLKIQTDFVSTFIYNPG